MTEKPVASPARKPPETARGRVSDLSKLAARGRSHPESTTPPISKYRGPDPGLTLQHPLTRKSGEPEAMRLQTVYQYPQSISNPDGSDRPYCTMTTHADIDSGINLGIGTFNPTKPPC